MEQLIQQFFNIDVMRQALPLMLRGLGMTLFLCSVIIPIGLAGGLLLCVLSMRQTRWVRWPTVVFIDILRALPPLVLLILVYSGIPFTGVQISPFWAVCLAFGLNTSSYYGEIYRAGIESIPVGQYEAARSTGLSQTQAFGYIILPQAVRNVLPDLVSNTLEVVKLTSLASVVALSELLYAANMARSLLYNPSTLVLAALIYIAILWPVVRLLSRLEHKNIRS
jgi:polar amino acid transport system permease protein